MASRDEERPAEVNEIRIRLVCGNCGKIERFHSWQEAFDKGWDTVERFGYNACDQCPGVSVYFPMMYAQQAREAADPVERALLLDKAAKATLEHERFAEQT